MLGKSYDGGENRSTASYERGSNFIEEVSKKHMHTTGWPSCIYKNALISQVRKHDKRLISPELHSA
jgi:hypothetical protein